MTDQWLPGDRDRWRNRLQKEHKLWFMMKMFIILIMMMVSQIYTYGKNYILYICVIHYSLIIPSN